MRIADIYIYFKKARLGRHNGGPVVKNLPSKCRDMGLIPGRGTKISHAAGWLSLSATSRNPHSTTREAFLLQQRPDTAKIKNKSKQTNKNNNKGITHNSVVFSWGCSRTVKDRDRKRSEAANKSSCQPKHPGIYLFSIFHMHRSFCLKILQLKTKSESYPKRFVSNPSSSSFLLCQNA